MAASFKLSEDRWEGQEKKKQITRPDVHAQNITGKLTRHSRKGVQLKKPGDSHKLDPTNYSTDRFQYPGKTIPATNGSYVPV